MVRIWRLPPLSCTPGLGWGDWGSRIRFPTACQNGGMIVLAGRRHTTRMAARPAGRGPDGDLVVSPTSGGLTVTQPRRASPRWRFGWQLAASAMLRRDAPNCRRSARFLRQLLRLVLRFCRSLVIGPGRPQSRGRAGEHYPHPGNGICLLAGEQMSVGVHCQRDRAVPHHRLDYFRMCTRHRQPSPTGVGAMKSSVCEVSEMPLTPACRCLPSYQAGFGVGLFM